MKANKLLKTLAASAMSLALMASVTAMPAMAAGVTGSGSTPVTTIPFTVTITTDGNSYEPDTNLTFNVTKGDAGTVAMPTSDGGSQNVAVLEGIVGGVSIAAIDTDPATTGNPAASYENRGSVTINPTTFTTAAPGIYRYVISQATGNVEGMVYDDSVYDLYLYVENGSAGNNTNNYVAYAVAVERTSTGDPGAAKTDLAFTNTYGTGTSTLYDLTIKKVVEGDMGDKVNDGFSFTVTITGTTGEVYYIEYTNGTGTQTATATSGEGVTLNDIRHDDVITVYGLSAGDKFAVTEGANNMGYTVYADKSYTTGGSSANDQSDEDIYQGSAINTTTMGEQNHAVAFYNVKTAVTPTGIILNIAPYALMVVIAVAGVAVFMRKRVEE